MNYNKLIPKQCPPEDMTIVFSFETLNFNEFFNIDCTCSNWSIDLMKMLQSISLTKCKQFNGDMGFRSGKYRIHNHKDVKPPIKFPYDIDMKNVLQIRLGGSKGGVHGFLIENIFYVVWLDPLHNMYPDDRFGGLKKIKSPNTCCGWRDEELKSLSEENQRLLDENKELQDYFDSLDEKTSDKNNT